MRAVKRRDGIRRADVRVTFVLSRSEIIDALCYRIDYEMTDLSKLPKTMGQQKVMERVREALVMKGENFWTWAEHVQDPGREEALREWANEQVSRFWSANA